LKINEIFTSIQGEGPATGQLVTFIRTAGCNLSCARCDTDHHENSELAPKEVQAAVKGRCVITGGEPCLQPDLLQVANLISSDLETNGTIPINPAQFRYVVVSPKRGSDVDFDYWQKFSNVHFKFVIGPAPWCWSTIPPGLKNVWLMPFGTDSDLKWAKRTWNLSIALGYNYSDRLHIRVGGR